MKKVYIGDLSKNKDGVSVEIYGWISRVHLLKNTSFLDISDSTGTIQCVVSSKNLEKLPRLRPEDAILVKGVLRQNKKRSEIEVEHIKVIGESVKSYTPNPRSSFDIFDKKYSPLLNKNRHIYIRNPKMIHIFKMRHYLMIDIRNWFNKKGFIELNAPILTQNTLYDEGSAIKVMINGKKVFLTQCVGYYLEASVHALEKVYNIGPSFRGKESHTKRHLMEYWHVKAEIAFVDLEEMIGIVEDLICNIFASATKFNSENKKILGKEINNGIKKPFPRISYEEAIIWLNKHGSRVKFGEHIASSDEKLLGKKYKNMPVWIIGNPREIEPFPYAIDNSDKRNVKTADLVVGGYGEILGVAEKISELNMLKERMQEKKRDRDKRYNWIKEVHQLGPIPHSAVGMGFERLMRWVFNIEHVKDTIPFPRTFRKPVYP